jgi:nicotinate-nucleotide adenylyltransferase
MSELIGLYGGSFDPIHLGHVTGARAVAGQLGLKRVIFIPSARPPHKLDRPLTDAAHRLAMTRLAVAEEPQFEVSDIELHRTGPSYTFDTVTEYHRRLGETVSLCWIIGADTLPELPTWYRIRELVRLVRIVTMARPGWTPPAPGLLASDFGVEVAAQLLRDCLITPEVEVSASEVRARIQRGDSIEGLVHPDVKSYILEHRLYRT